MKRPLIWLLKFYKSFISPILERSMGKACRFTPSCSEYTIEALDRFGAIKGLGLGVKRFLRCHPLGGYGFDPVPKRT